MRMVAASNAEACAGEDETVAVVEEVLGAEPKDVLARVKGRGAWRSAAENFTYGSSSSASAED